MRDCFDLLEMLDDVFPGEKSHVIYKDKETDALVVQVWLEEEKEYFSNYIEFQDLKRTPGELLAEIKWMIGD